MDFVYRDPHILEPNIVFVLDSPGFASFMTSEQYKTYADYVIRPSYILHQEMGLLQYTMDGVKRENEMSFRNFFSGRILWDESMACNAYRWTSQNPGKLLIGLVGADHGTFYIFYSNIIC